MTSIVHSCTYVISYQKPNRIDNIHTNNILDTNKTSCFLDTVFDSVGSTLRNMYCSHTFPFILQVFAFVLYLNSPIFLPSVCLNP